MLSYTTDCENYGVDGWSDREPSQQFRFVGGDGVHFEWKLEAVGRSHCQTKFLRYNWNDCNDQGLWLGWDDDAGRFRLHPAQREWVPEPQAYADSGEAIADPFVWHSPQADAFFQVRR